MSKITIATVNALLKSKGIEERVFMGKDYLYFAEGNASAWPATSVYVCRASELSLEEWLKEYESLKGAVSGGCIQ